MDPAEKRRLKRLGKRMVEEQSRELDERLSESNPAPVGSDEWSRNYRRATLKERELRHQQPDLIRAYEVERDFVLSPIEPISHGLLTGYLGAAFRLCSDRPRLAEELAPVGFEALIEAGVDSPEAIVSYVDGCLRDSGSYLASMARGQTMAWERMLSHAGHLFAKARSMNEEKLLSIERDWLRRHSSRNVDSVEIVLFADKLDICQYRKAVVFATDGWRGEGARFRKLTDVLAEVDPGESIRLVLTDIWDRPICLQPDIEILWVSGGEIFDSLGKEGYASERVREITQGLMATD